jgi:hypothetical protein
MQSDRDRFLGQKRTDRTVRVNEGDCRFKRRRFEGLRRTDWQLVSVLSLARVSVATFGRFALLDAAIPPEMGVERAAKCDGQKVATQ